MTHETNNRLSVLADEIRAANDALQRSAEETAERALALGSLLVEAKEKVKHGEWAAWLAANTAVSDRSARGYMQLARAGVKTATVADLGLRASLAMVGRSRPKVDAGTEMTDAERNAESLVGYMKSNMSADDFARFAEVALANEGDEHFLQRVSAALMRLRAAEIEKNIGSPRRNR